MRRRTVTKRLQVHGHGADLRIWSHFGGARVLQTSLEALRPDDIRPGV